MDATIVAKCGYLVTQADVEECFVENIPFVDEAVSSTNPKEPERIMPYQDGVPTPEKSDEYITMEVLFPRGKVYQ